MKRASAVIHPLWLHSDNLPLVRSTRADPDVSVERTQSVVERWRNHVSAVSTAWSNIGFLVLSGKGERRKRGNPKKGFFQTPFFLIAVFAGVSFVPWSKGPFFNNEEPKFGNTTTYYCVASLVSGAYMLVNAIPYFVCRPIGRRGPPFPAGANPLTLGWKSIYNALK
jgi:hypothetical protein